MPGKQVRHVRQLSQVGQVRHVRQAMQERHVGNAINKSSKTMSLLTKTIRGRQKEKQPLIFSLDFLQWNGGRRRFEKVIRAQNLSLKLLLCFQDKKGFTFIIVSEMEAT